MAGAIRMNLCSNDHATICFDTWDCPLCDMRSDLRDELASLRATFDQLETEFNQLESEAYEHQQQNAHFRSILSDIAPEHLL